MGNSLLAVRGINHKSIVVGGITEEGVKVVNEGFPAIADTIFLRTLEKRRLTAQKAEELF